MRQRYSPNRRRAANCRVRAAVRMIRILL
jgi:hypothetical protein